MSIEVTPELLRLARDYLGITWEDEATDRKLTGQIRRGMAYLADKTGVDKTAPAFLSDDRAQMLLLNWLLYDRAGALDEFTQNHRSEILGLKLKNDVKRVNHASETEN